MRRRLTLVALYGATTALCFILGHWDRIGADCYFFEKYVEGLDFRFYYRSALTVYIHQIVYLILYPFGVIPWYAIGLSSSLAGAGYLFVLYRFSRSLVFWILNLSAGCVWIFFGHVENYAWVSFFLVLSLYELREYEEGRQPLWKSSVCYFLAVACHHLAIFYAPGYVYFLRGRRLRDRDWMEIVVPMIACTLFFVIVPLLVETKEGIDLGFERLVPWLSPWAKNHYFTLFSVDHLRMLVFFHRTAAPFGVPFLALALIGLYGWRLSSRFLQSLLVMSMCGVIWTTFWHPDWGYRDWDLFGQFGILVNLLAGLLLVHKEFQGQRLAHEFSGQTPTAQHS
ncbi:MAG: hypothetical protein ABIH23_34690 [bacterium]